MTARRASAADAAAFAALDARAGAGGWSQATYRELLSEPGSVGMLWEGAGFALLQIAADVADVLMVAVDPDQRRKGIARTCLSAAMAEAQAGGVTRVLLEVAQGNTGARALYEAMGFAEVAVRKGYYSSGPHAGEDALVMALGLDGLERSGLS